MKKYNRILLTFALFLCFSLLIDVTCYENNYYLTEAKTVTVTAPAILDKGYEGTFHKITMKADKKSTIYYTIDGSNPNKAANKYSSGIVLKCGKTYTIKAIAYVNNQKSKITKATYFSKQSTLGKKADDIINSKIKSDMNVYEKILAIECYFCDNIEYGKGKNYGAATAEGALLDGKAMCSGYSSGFKLLMDLLGIPCYIVSGSVRGEGHEWNMVKIDGNWYHLEPQVITDLRSDSNMKECDYDWETDDYPECKKNYFDNIKDFYVNKYNVPIFQGSDKYSYDFEFVQNLTYIEIGKDITDIEARSFSQLNNLETVVISEGVTTIGCCAFTTCPKLKNITIPDSVTTIYSIAFSYCESLQTLKFPNNIKRIEESVLEGCSKLKNVSIPEGVEYIGDCAFMDCISLKEITIPESVTDIGWEVFENCSDIVIYGKSGSYAEEYAAMEDIKFVAIP